MAGVIPLVPHTLRLELFRFIPLFISGFDALMRLPAEELLSTERPLPRRWISPTTFPPSLTEVLGVTLTMKWDVFHTEAERYRPVQQLNGCAPICGKFRFQRGRYQFQRTSHNRESARFSCERHRGSVIAVANTAGFHFPKIDQRGSSLST